MGDRFADRLQQGATSLLQKFLESRRREVTTLASIIRSTVLDRRLLWEFWENAGAYWTDGFLWEFWENAEAVDGIIDARV
jgi:hypothetical protein